MKKTTLKKISIDNYWCLKRHADELGLTPDEFLRALLEFWDRRRKKYAP